MQQTSPAAPWSHGIGVAFADALGRLGLQPSTSSIFASSPFGPGSKQKRLFGRRLKFLVREGCSRCEPAPEPEDCHGLLTGHFHIRDTHQHNAMPSPRLVVPPAPDLGDSGDALDDVADLFNQHIIPSMGSALARTPLAGPAEAAQHAALEHLERYGRWVGVQHPWAMTAKDQWQYGSTGTSTSAGGITRESREIDWREAERLARKALEAQQRCNPELAASLYSELVKIHPSADNYARLSKQLTDMTYMSSIKNVRDRVVELNSKAVEVAGVAVGTDPNRPLPHIARCVSRGRLALVSDNRTKVHLAKDAADDAAAALRADPTNDLAHHLMGRWHYEMAQINAVARTLIRLLFGTSLMVGTFNEALVHYKTAAELCPERLIHRVELGKTYAKLGDKANAVQEFRAALELEIEDINAHLTKEDAHVLLRQLQSHGLRGWFNSPKPPEGTAT